MYHFYKKQRPEKEMIFGVRAVIEAIEAGIELEKILIRRDMSNDLSRELLSSLKGSTAPLQKVPSEKLNRITRKNHQGVIAFISPVVYQKIEDIIPVLYEEGKIPFIVALDGVTDVRNFGAIARTCECVGVDAMVIPVRGGATVNADAVKTSAGALLKIPVCREQNLSKTLQFLKNSGIKLIAATEKAADDYNEVDYTVPVAIVVGAEDVGISDENLRLCDESVKIPLWGTIESLNVAVAAGVIMCEAAVQRKLGRKLGK
ncbi:MAG: 23S rRNA (guanosine(2251)-2'-O)-methyltransferase RlmB [Prevotellaceae bacterium]|jgi:23S rRNA (guanosine2251-2'-O)-methyltransferase|nr:23S rRNA (guanosine(2251)-2'-O)-methyltransferase RlmB [Prevotellaceae bacterium]